MDKAHILIVEDEVIVARSIQKRLKGLGYTVPTTAASGEEALRIVGDTQPDLVLMDIKLKGAMDGIETVQQIQATWDIPVIYLTAYADEETLERAKVTQPFGYLLKPFELSELRSTVEMALYKHQMQRKLEENERWLTATLKSIGDGVITTDTRGCVTFMNPVAEVLTGWNREEAVGRNLQEIFHVIDQETRQVALGSIADLLKEGDTASLGGNILLVARDGTETPIDDSGAPIVDDRGNITGGVLVFHDISERKRAEEILRQRNQELELLNRASHAFISTLDLDRVLANVLEEVRRVLGVVACSAWLVDPETGGLVCQQVTDPQGEIVRGWRLAPGQGLAGWVTQHGESLNVPDVQADQRHFKGVDQQTGLRLRSILTVPLRVKQEVIGVVQVVDAAVGRFSANHVRLVESLASTAAIAIENASLYEETDHLRAFNQNIVQSMEEGILLTDAGGHITFVNPRGGDLLGYAPEELTGRPMQDFVAPEHREQVEQEFALAPQGVTLDLPAARPLDSPGQAGRASPGTQRGSGLAGRRETVLLTKMGRRVPVIVSSRPLFDDGNFTGMLSVITDITERVQMEEALRESLAKIKTLGGLIPICASCKKIRDDKGYWQQVEVYIRDHSEAEFSHGLCPECAQRLYPEFYVDEGG
jgi:PAS domain S-box-containing protein